MLKWSPGLAGGPDLFPGKPGRPAALFGAVVVCARAAGAPTTVPIKRTAATVVILIMVCLHWMPDQSFGGSLVRKNGRSTRPVGNETHYCPVMGTAKRPLSGPGFFSC